MRSHWKPIVTLLVVTPFLTELLSGNLPASVLFRPQVFLFLATVGYGFPVLLLREFAVRRRLGALGLFVLGLVYGIFNEGILAKTFYLAKSVPIPNFDGFGFLGGIAVPWAVTISVWHALHALLYPIVAVYYFFPNHRESPWLNWKWITGLAIPTVLFGTLMFFGDQENRPAGLLAHLILMMTISGLLIWLATKLPASPKIGGDEKLKLSPIFWGGLGFVLLLFIPIVFASVKISMIDFYGYHVLFFAGTFYWLRRQAWLPVTTVLLFALGDDSVTALVGFASAVGQASVEKLVTDAGFLAGFAWLFFRIRRAVS